MQDKAVRRISLCGKLGRMDSAQAKPIAFPSDRMMGFTPFNPSYKFKKEASRVESAQRNSIFAAGAEFSDL